MSMVTALGRANNKRDTQKVVRPTITTLWRDRVIVPTFVSHKLVGCQDKICPTLVYFLCKSLTCADTVEVGKERDRNCHTPYF